ncbi:baseplate assembly protein [Chelativorans sp. ZYF759]|uniref:baseplate J/gp47 family protein n=1 Tax=Chelativorans sp. ZYF759 TaxID=2692213 RepID=UPI00145DB96E|nr:baseplate J/gp47 family protein [Chelativorans sp. ZYF759]NMG39807.1 baseplate assembly protein [Chelativorans sp. ZYF759]
MSAPTTIDLSRLPFPAAIEALDFETLFAAFRDRFQAAWDEARADNPDLPPYEVGGLETDPVAIVGQAWSYLRLLDRARVNDAVRSVLAPMARGSDLDQIASRQGVLRLELVPASGNEPAVMEGDAQLLRRYLLSFDRPSAGSASRYLYEAWTSAPKLHDVRVNGRAVHGRIGDTDVVIIGENGVAATQAELAVVQAAVQAPDVKPEAVGVSVLPATRHEFQVVQTILVPVGPDAEIVRKEAEDRVRLIADSRMKIGAGVPRDLLAGASFGPSVIDVQHHEPVADIVAHPYTVPVLTLIDITVEVAS